MSYERIAQLEARVAELEAYVTAQRDQAGRLTSIRIRTDHPDGIERIETALEALAADGAMGDIDVGVDFVIQAHKVVDPACHVLDVLVGTQAGEALVLRHFGELLQERSNESEN